MTSCTKPIWKITFEDSRSDKRTQLVLAWTFTEAIGYFNSKGVSTIVNVEKTSEQATYYY